MKHINGMLRSIRSSITRVLGSFNSRLKLLEKSSASQSRRLANLGAKESPSIHAMEIKQDKTVEDEKERRGAMGDPELREELVKQYGTTRWATKLINEKLN